MSILKAFFSQVNNLPIPASLPLSLLLVVPATLRLLKLQILLPALHGSLPTQLYLSLISLPLFLLSSYLPPIVLLPLLPLLPAVHAAALPLFELCLLAAITGLGAGLHRFPALAVAVPIIYAPPQVISHPLTVNISQHAQSFIVSLVTCLIATRSFALGELQQHFLAKRRTPPSKVKSKSKSRRRGSAFSLFQTVVLRTPRHVFTAFLFAAVFGLSEQALIPAGAFVVKHLYPRRMPTNYSILAQERGPTGLVSVVQRAGKYRLLTADLSVLGGRHTREGYAQDSIFAQFYVHEAVRLTKRPNEDPEVKGGRNGNALCLGLGIGVVADAFHRLGSRVVAVEIDPVVAKYATRYFGMSAPNVTKIDAVEFLERAKSSGERYDYVVHDVFTGGAVPGDLFSMDTWRGVRDVMEDDGVLAVNFVGAIDDPPTTPAVAAVALVYDRLKKVFGNVKLFSDGQDNRTHNLVFFASPVAQRLMFRDYVESDLMESGIRKEALDAFQRFEIKRELLGPGIDDIEGSDWILHMGQWDTCKIHLDLMKTIHPKDLWPALYINEQLR